ncbi:MAG: SpaH/EbpB family LPXTG-anchored major pilin [Streptococcaceae bacterium]|nr:SpaH/EbpB family LPXTG-anchored major pilin [Streptococcaceae bacterium]
MQLNLKKINKKFALLGTGLILASTLAGAAGGLSNTNAATYNSANTISNGEVKIYAESAAGNTSTSQNNGGTAGATGSGTDSSGNDTGIANNQTPAQQGNASSTVNDGSAQTVTSPNGTMANVTFTATQWNGTGAPTVDANGNPTSTTTGWGGTQTSVTTDSTGLADFKNLPTGYYLFQQTTTVNGIVTVKPFIVQVSNGNSNYSAVNVYPKLDMSFSSGIGDVVSVKPADQGDNATGKTPNEVDNASGTTKGSLQDTTILTGTTPNNTANNGNTVSNSLTSTTDDSTSWTATSGNNENTNTAAAGDTAAWNVNTVFDASQVSGTNDGSYVVTDVLPDGVTYSSTKVTAVTPNGNVPLTSGNDYTVSQSGQTVTITLTDTGKQKIAATAGNADSQLNTQILTLVSDGTVGSLKDSASYKATNAYGVVLSDGTKTVSSTLNVGGLDLTKTDALTGQALSGAKFTLVAAKSASDITITKSADGKTVTGITVANGGYLVPGGTDGTVDTTNGDTTDLSSAASVTTDTSGTAKFTGLNLVDNNTDDSNTTTYFLVETQAPSGYTLPDTAFGAENANTSPKVTDNTVTNATVFELPFTGGRGIAMIVIVAAGAGFAAFAIRRRKGNEEEKA